MDLVQNCKHLPNNRKLILGNGSSFPGPARFTHVSLSFPVLENFK
uniref:Uncharacterized protein n=1 Tax=Pyxicephalus adspersus TaxID=30357 RepID=A0A499QI90_PYXAD|nr:hypothetical protein maker-66O13-exonerate_protein2genome-gene-0.9 [Pyxicephalus adspersus]